MNASSASNVAEDLRRSEGDRRGLHFVLDFALAAVAFELVFLAWIDGSAPFRWYLGVTAQVAALVLNSAGFAVTCSGTVIHTGGEGIELLRGCDALEPAGLFLLAVAFFPSDPLRRLRGGVLGAALFLALNLVRVVSLAIVQVHEPSIFEPLHVDVWPVVFLFVAVGTFVLWARTQPHPRSPR